MRAPLLILGVLLGLSGCGGSMGAAKAAFRDGHYADAKRRFLSLAPEEERWDRPRRAEYALYLGLTQAELGDVDAALPWLSRAYAEELAHPGTLSPIDWARLRLGLDALAPPEHVDDARPLEGMK